MIEAFKGGELECAMILAPLAISLRAQGVPLKIALLGHRNGTGLVLSNEIEGLQELRGRTVAIPIRYSTQNLALQEILSRNGMDSSQLSIVEMPPPDMPSALAAGAISAYIVGEPYASQAKLNNKGRIFMEADEIIPDFISSVLIISEKFIEKDRKTANWIVSSLYRQGKWIERHRKTAAEIAARAYGLPEELLATVLVSSKTRVRYSKLIPSRKDIQKTEQLMIKWNLLSQPVEEIIYTAWTEGIKTRHRTVTRTGNEKNQER